MDRRIELPGLAYGSIAAPATVAKDAVAFRRSSSAVGQRSMPAGNSCAHCFDAQILDRIETEHRLCLHTVLWYQYTTVPDSAHLGESEPEAWLGTTNNIEFVAKVGVAALLFEPAKIRVVV